ncbi:hypothetical protein [Variovorax sp. GT1P44]|uniref:hypothetical protein n=1 Tax=Variovorax sp. GT1P44 TaxID=3443742 RepID=UPI003F48B540
MSKTFDDLQVRRPDLAKAYIGLLSAQPGRPVAMFAPRRVGKTYFLDNDLAPAAAKAGMLPVYADLWANKSDPLGAINHALEEALDDILVPNSRMARIGHTPIKKVGLIGASIDMGEAPARRPLPAEPHLRLDALVTRLSAAAGKPILLMLDEVQTLADVPEGDGIVAAVRAVLHKRRDIVKAVFTGSNQEGLARMLSTAGSPMYQFAQIMDFPTLGDEYLQQLAEHFQSVHPSKTLAMDHLRALYARIGFKPGLLKDVVKGMSAEGITDVDLGVKHFLVVQASIFNALLVPFDAFDRALLRAIARGMPPMGKATFDELEKVLPGKATPAKARASVERLRRAGILTKVLGGPVAIDDALLAEYLAGGETPLRN